MIKPEEQNIKIEIITQDVFTWIRKTKKESISSKIINFENEKFDFIYLDPPYKEFLDKSLLNLIFTADFIKKSSIVIYEHAKNNFIEDSNIWKIIDKRKYGQTKVTFLIKI